MSSVKILKELRYYSRPSNKNVFYKIVGLPVRYLAEFKHAVMIIGLYIN